MSRAAAARALAAAVIGVAGAIAFSAPASAHSTIVDSAPSEGETLTELPAAFSVTANEDLLDATGTGQGFVLAIVAEDGTHYETGTIRIDGATLSTPAALGPGGDYVLQYRVVSADGHPIEGEIPFTWAPGGATAEPTPLHTPDESEPDEGPVAEVGAPGWLAGTIAVALIAVGGLAAALSHRRG